jgi:hypothetical protein
MQTAAFGLLALGSRMSNTIPEAHFHEFFTP